MLKLEKNKSLKQKIGVFLGGAFLAMSFGVKPAIANDLYDDYFKVEYVCDDDNHDTYKLIIVSDFEMHNSVITTIDFFEKAIEESSDDVIINGICFDKNTLVTSKLHSYDNIIDKDSIITTEGNNLDFQYIYDEDHVGKHKRDKGSYKLITLSDYTANVSIVTTTSIFENLLESQHGDIVVINGFEFDKNKLLDAKKRALDGIDEKKIKNDDEFKNKYIDIEYIYDDNHSTNKYSLDLGDFDLVTIVDYEYNNVVTTTVNMLNHALEHSKGDYVTINNITFDKNVLIDVKGKMDNLKESKVTAKTAFNIFSIIVIAMASVSKSLSKQERNRRY